MNKISIALCTFNGSKYLTHQLDSFISQERQPDEVIICDDRSSDRTHKIVNDFIKKASFKVKFVVNNNNLGITKNFEKAVHLCTGDLIALSDQDDVWHSKKIERCEKLFSDQPDVGVLFSNADIVDINLTPLGYDMFNRVNFSKKEQHQLINNNGLSVLLKHYIVTGATMCFRADYKSAVLPIPSCWFHDTWIALVIASISNMTFIEEPMIKYRQHSNNQIGGIKTGFIKQVARALHVNREDYYKTEIHKYHVILDRLSDIAESFMFPKKNTLLLKDKINHLEIRASMKKNRIFRLPVIISELLKLRYQRYSRNWGSIALDLLFK